MNKLLTTAVIIIASFTSAGAHQWSDQDQQQEAYMADSSVSQTAVVDNNDNVRCWGWDGSTNGQMKTMSRGQCLDMHGTVQNQDIRASDNPTPAKKHKHNS